MIKVKICGLTRSEDHLWANALKPDYVGFVFAPSRRRITLKQARFLDERLDRSIARVGVFVNPVIEEITAIIKTVNLNVIQLHGDEGPDFCKRIELPVWKAFRIGNNIDTKEINKYKGKIEAVVLDRFDKNSFGGTGEPFPWHLAQAGEFDIPLVLAGGLTSENVETAAKIVKPSVVDVSSGVESNGVKDESKISDFIKKVRILNEA